MKKLIVIANDAQACGKSSIALVLEEFLARRQVRRLLTLTSVEQELPKATEMLDLEEDVCAGDVVELIDRTDSVIVDVHTGGHEDFARLVRGSGLDEALTDIETELTVVVPVCEDAEVLRGAKEVAEAYAGIADFVVVRSPLLADMPEAWDLSPTRKALQLLGAVEITAPGLADPVLDSIDSLDLDLPLAMSQRRLLPRFLRNELLAWEVAYAECLAPVTELLIPKRDRVNDPDFDSAYGKAFSL